MNAFSKYFLKLFLIISTYTDFEVAIEFFQVLNNFSTICIKRKKIQCLFTNYCNIGIHIYWHQFDTNDTMKYPTIHMYKIGTEFFVKFSIPLN